MKQIFTIAGLAAALIGTAIVPGSAETVIRLGTVLPENNPVGMAFEKFGTDVVEATNGEVRVEVFHNSQLGDTHEMLDQASAGSNIGLSCDMGLLSSFVPELGVMSAPFLFDSPEDIEKFTQSDVFREWSDQLQTSANIVMLTSNIWQGPRHLVTQMPVSQPSDLKGIRIRTLESPVWIETVRAMGGTPTTMSWGEVYQALQLGALDGAEVQPVAIEQGKLNEVAKHVTTTGHIHLVTAMVIGVDVWNKISPEHQEIVRQLAHEAGRYASDLTKELSDQALADVAENGMTVSEPDLEVFRDAVQGVYEKVGLTDSVAVVNSVLGR